MNQEQETGAQDSAEMAQDLEGQIEHLTQETAQLIHQADPAQRTELREYALDLLQEETETNAVAEATSTTRRRTVPFNPLGLAIPLLLIGGILCLAFPPLGIALLLVAAFMGMWGILIPLLRHKQ